MLREFGGSAAVQLTPVLIIQSNSFPFGRCCLLLQGGRDISVVSVRPIINVAYQPTPGFVVSTGVGALTIAVHASSTVITTAHAQQLLDETVLGLHLMLGIPGYTVPKE